MFCAIIVLPSPLVPIRIRLRASGRKSNVSARSMTSRSILVGQDQLKSAMGLNFLISESRRRRARLRWARSAISLSVRCSRICRGDRRCLVARARKSSTPAAKACKPICSSCDGRLLFGVVVARMGELIVGLQIVGTDIQRLRLRMAAEIHCRQGRSALIPAQQKSDRGGTWRIPFQRFPDGAAQSGYAVQIQQAEQVGGLTGGRFSLSEGA